MIDKKSKILLVDDIQLNIELLKAYFKPYNYVLLDAFNGKQALKIVIHEFPDLILLDALMPDYNGCQVCKILKSNEFTKHIPIIMTSALKDMGVEGRNAGAIDFVLKPFNRNELLVKVETILKKSDKKIVYS